ncbi:hypothetical protein B9G55_01385 [Saccharibacillus sp. O16]|nr:hypothetical protein B9G55_01385 [Saccharibacillus sp. O16]
MAKKKPEAEPLHERSVLTSELAAIVGKTPRWINQLSRQKVLTQVGRGKYVLGESIQQYIEHAAGGREEDKQPRLIDYKTEHERVKAEKAQLELAKMKGELHLAADIELLLNDLVVTIKARMLAIPQRLAPELDHEPAAVIEEAIRREIHAALSALAKYTPSMVAGEMSGADDS